MNMQGASRPPIPVDEAGIVVGDVACRGCSYNLRGLPAESNCPECATAIELSLEGNLLHFCDPKWLDRLAIGAGMIAGSLLIEVFIVSPLISVLASPLNSFMRPMQKSIVLASSVLAFCGT